MRRVPELNTAALPDLIFTVLFFFMIVTHMRQTDVKVQVKTPEGTQLQKMQKRYATTYIYIGNDKKGNTQVQLNNNIIPLSHLTDAVRSQRSLLPVDEQQYHTVSIKADHNVPLSYIADVKDALRKANVQHINYSATQIKEK